MTTTKLSKSWLNMVKQSNTERTAMILEMLGISEADYNDMWLDAGVYYLVNVIEVGVWEDELMSARLYWSWWLNHWQKWDARFIGYAKVAPADQWAKLYDDVHDVKNINFKPHAIILEEIFHKEVVMELTKGNYE